MPARSLRVTEAYRARLLKERAALEVRAERSWPTIRQLDGTDWSERIATATATRQATAVRLAGAYLAAFIASETGKRTPAVRINPEPYVGVTRDGRTLDEALRSPLIGVLGQMKDGVPYEQALEAGLNRAKRMVGVEFDYAHRQALLDAIKAHPQTEGWQRALAGTCGACAAVADGTVSGSLRFEVHPGCQCVSQPVVVSKYTVGSPAQLLTGREIFEAKTAAEQDEMLGPEAAALIRAGSIVIEELRDRSPLSEGEDFITQKPVKDLLH